MNPADIIHMADASNTLAQTGASAAPVFSSLLPIGLLITGILVGGMLVAAIMFGFTGAVGSMVDRFTHRQ